MMTGDEASVQRVGARSAAVGNAVRGLFWLVLTVLAGATLYGLLASDGSIPGALADDRGVVVGLALALALLALVLRRHVGAVLAGACGAVQAVWLMPALLAPSVAVGDVPDGAARVASVAMAAAGHAQDRVVAVADRSGAAAYRVPMPWQPSPATLGDGSHFPVMEAWTIRDRDFRRGAESALAVTVLRVVDGRMVAVATFRRVQVEEPAPSPGGPGAPVRIPGTGDAT